LLGVKLKEIMFLLCVFYEKHQIFGKFPFLDDSLAFHAPIMIFFTNFTLAHIEGICKDYFLKKNLEIKYKRKKNTGCPLSHLTSYAT